MADDIVRRLTISANGQGIDPLTSSLKGLSDATDALATVTDTSAKKALSAEAAYNRQTLAIDPAARAQASIARGTKTANDALAQGVITQDEHSKRVQAITDKYTTQVGASAALGKATQAMQLQFASLAGGLGLTGSILTAFGGYGFAAAVGLGAVSAALNTASEMAHNLAEKAKEIREFAEQTGFSTIQFQALRSEAGKFGIDSETLAGGLAKFSVGFQELRLGQGDLLTQIRRVNPALAEQMQTTTDAATAFTLFGKAVSQTSDVFERNAMLKAGLGRGSAIYGGMFAAGTIDVLALGEAAKAAGRGIDEDLIKRLAQLQIDIAKTKSAATTVFATMFGTSTLEGELAFNRGLLDIAKNLRDFRISDSLSKFIDFMTDPKTLGVIAALATVGAIATAPVSLPIAAGLGIAGAGLVAGAVVSDVRGRGRAATKYDKSNNEDFKDRWGFQSGSDGPIGPVQPAKTPQADLAALKALTDILGQAATPAEQLNLKLAELALKAKDAGTSSDDLTRAQNALKNAFAVDQLAAKNAALGASVTPTEQLALATARLVQQYNQGRISRETLTRALQAANNATFQSTVAAREQLGIATQQELQEVNLQRINDATAKGYIKNAQDKIDVEGVFQRQLKDTQERMLVLKSATPQLTQLGLDAGNLNKQIDTVATGAMTSLGDGLLSIANGSATAGNAFKSFGTAVVTSLEKMIIQMTIIKPLMSALGGGSGNFLSFLGLGGGGGTATGVSGTGSAVSSIGANASGTDNWRGGLTSINEKGGEIIDLPSGSRVIPHDISQGMATGGPISVVVNNNGSTQMNVKAKEVQDGRGSRRLELTLDDAIANALSNAGSQTRKSMGTNFGAKPQTIRRG